MRVNAKDRRPIMLKLKESRTLTSVPSRLNTQATGVNFPTLK